MRAGQRAWLSRTRSGGAACRAHALSHTQVFMDAQLVSSYDLCVLIGYCTYCL